MSTIAFVRVWSILLVACVEASTAFGTPLLLTKIAALPGKTLVRQASSNGTFDAEEGGNDQAARPSCNDGNSAFSYYSRADEQDDEIVTQEMLWRDLLEDPKVKRRQSKSKNTTYKTLDNRDALPFVVQVVTPDPYTPPEQQAREARKNTEMQKKSKKKIIEGDLTLGMGSGNRQKSPNNIAASIYALRVDGSRQRVLGEFHLDKSTTCGDILEVGAQKFQVQSARCQYKYAGGKRFVMVRKILEVKEVTRAEQEASLQRKLNQTQTDDQPPALE